MSIRIGFDHGENMRTRSHCFNALEIMMQSIQMNSDCGWPTHTLIIASCEIFKTAILTEERKAYFPNGAITLLSNNNFCSTFIWTIIIVDFIAINKGNEVCVLFDGA